MRSAYALPPPNNKAFGFALVTLCLLVSSCGDQQSFELVEIDEPEISSTDLLEIADSFDSEDLARDLIEEEKINCDMEPTGDFVDTEEGWLFVSDTLYQGCMAFQFHYLVDPESGPDYHYLDICNRCDEARSLDYWWIKEAPPQDYDDPAVTLPYYSRFSFDGEVSFSASLCSQRCRYYCDSTCTPKLCTTAQEVVSYTLEPREHARIPRDQFWLPFSSCPHPLLCDGKPYSGAIFYDIGLPHWRAPNEPGRTEHSNWALCDALGLDPSGEHYESSADIEDWHGEGIDWHPLLLHPPADVYEAPLCTCFYCEDLEDSDELPFLPCNRTLLDADLGDEVCKQRTRNRGHTAVIASAEENQDVYDLSAGQSHWIGLRRGDVGWVWSVGSNLEETGYSNWAQGQPDTLGDCVIVDGEGQWQVRDCSELHGVLCQQ